MKSFSLMILSLMTLAACSQTGPDDLKSPCAGISGSPCVRRPVNDWWMGARERAEETSGFWLTIG